ncbi:MAG: hypothetical protein AAGI34_09815 [Pseudomonadota bacterium]
MNANEPDDEPLDFTNVLAVSAVVPGGSWWCDLLGGKIQVLGLCDIVGTDFSGEIGVLYLGGHLTTQKMIPARLFLDGDFRRLGPSEVPRGS